METDTGQTDTKAAIADRPVGVGQVWRARSDGDCGREAAGSGGVYQHSTLGP